MRLANAFLLGSLTIALSCAVPWFARSEDPSITVDRPPVESEEGEVGKTPDDKPVSPAEAVTQPDSADMSSGEPQKRALLVGINDYATIRDLYYCGRDIQQLRDRLTAAGFPAANVVVMHDGAGESQLQPFRARVERELEAVLAAAGPDDLVLFAFSGHGVHVEGASYLCPIEAELAKPKKTMIPLEEVYRRLAACQARQKLLLIDACRNDPRPGGTKSISKPTRSIDDFARSLDQSPEGILLLTSCRPGQVSIEDESLRHGVFMHYLLKGLEGDADRGKEGNFDGQISFLELFNYASLNTKTHVMRTRSLLQEPLLRGEIAGDCQLAVALPPRPGKLPSRFYTERAAQYNYARAFQWGGETIISSNPRTRLALMRAYELLQLGSYSSEGIPKADCQEAITACNEAMRLEPGNPFAYLFRGIAYRKLGEYDHALADFQKIDMPLRLEMNYVRKPVELKLGDRVGGTVDSRDVLIIAEVQGKMLRVESVTSSAPSEEGPSEKEPPAKQGWIHQRYVKKELQFLNNDPESVLRYILDKDGSLVKLKADAPKALEALLRARDILYGNEKSEYDALRRDMTAEECDRAIAACSEALRIEPDNPYAFILRGFAKRKKRDFDGALADFKKLDLPLCVRAEVDGSMQLKIGEQVTGEIRNGNDLIVTQIEGDWLWVDSVKYSDDEKHGWLLKQYVK